MIRAVPFLMLLALAAQSADLAINVSPEVDTYTAKLTPLVDPAKLAKLKSRGANPRVQKAVAILADAEAHGFDAGGICSFAIQRVKMKPAAGDLTKAALLRNLKIARELGCLNAAGLDDMRHGRSPKIRRGPYKGDELSVAAAKARAPYLLPIANPTKPAPSDANTMPR